MVIKEPSKAQFDQTLDKVGIDEKIVKKLASHGVMTVGHLKFFGLSNLARIGFFGNNLMRLLSGLESHGIGLSIFLSEKDDLDEQRMNMMNMPLARFFDASVILRVFYAHGLTRVKHIISMPKHVMADIFYKAGIDGNRVASGITETLKNEGIRMDEDFNIRFHKEKIKRLEPEKPDDKPIMELDISNRAKGILISEGIFTVGGIKENFAMFGAIPGIGAGMRGEIESVIQDISSGEKQK
ncbi:MAG: hypothetical protein IJW24_01820 [Clostridia bacterium]|nr:hypothetical protein [Clostridia bacterium]